VIRTSLTEWDCLANPEVVATSPGQHEVPEGCLSVPYREVGIMRPTSVVVKALDRRGRPVVRRYLGLEAKIAMHELDHLDGRLIIDYETELARI
jgi:peptide deformylase